MPHDALMLPFCRAIKHRSVLHVDAVRGLGTESLEHVLLLRMESSLANQRRGEKGRLTPGRSNKTGGLCDSNVFFFRLPLSHKINATTARKKKQQQQKQVILALGA